MKNKFRILNNKLNSIKGKGFIEMNSEKYTNAGLLLEKELGIEANDFSVADIDGIEIKALNTFTNTPITLFSCTCDGPDFFELNRLVERFGAKDYVFKDIKVLYTTISAKEFTSWGKYLKMKLHVDRKKRKIYIMVASVNEKIIEKRAFWNFDTLNDIMIRKLNYLCLVSFRTLIKNYTKYCHYFDFNYFRYTNFETFLSELEKGSISVNIKYGVYKYGKRAGKSYNHGTAFMINRDSLPVLFESLDIFEQKK